MNTALTPDEQKAMEKANDESVELFRKQLSSTDGAFEKYLTKQINEQQIGTI